LGLEGIELPQDENTALCSGLAAAGEFGKHRRHGRTNPNPNPNPTINTSFLLSGAEQEF